MRLKASPALKGLNETIQMDHNTTNKHWCYSPLFKTAVVVKPLLENTKFQLYYIEPSYTVNVCLVYDKTISQVYASSAGTKVTI